MEGRQITQIVLSPLGLSVLIQRVLNLLSRVLGQGYKFHTFPSVGHQMGQE